MAPHQAVYEHAALYDLAFSYRDIAFECRFLRSIYARYRGRAPRSFFELAAGPAAHSVEMLATGLDVLALDLAPAMAAHARRKAARRGLELPYVIGNMVEFAVPSTFELAGCLLCSASYLLTDDAVLSHLTSVRRGLVHDGLYVLELTHPAELAGAKRSGTSWAMRDAAGELYIDWKGDPARAVDGIWSTEASFVYRPFDGSPPTRVVDRAQQRGFTHSELTSLARRSGFEVEATFGGFDEAVPLDSAEATRMIVVLGRTA